MDCWHYTTWHISTAWISFLVLDVIYHASEAATRSEINQHLEMGRELVSRGQLADALSHYHAAAEGDPNNYLTFFKRGTVFLALSKAKLAITDFDHVLELKPDFNVARLQRGLAHFKLAQLDKAERDLETVLHQDPNNYEAVSVYNRVDPVRHDIKLAEAYVRGRDYHAAIELLTRLIEACPWSSYLRELRADCHSSLGNKAAAISDIRSTTKLQTDNTAGYYKLALLHYELGDAQESLREVRECLKLDPEHKDCFPHYKKVKRVEKLLNDMQDAANSKDYAECINLATKVLRIEPSAKMIRFQAEEKLCHCYLHENKLSLAIEYCTKALEKQKEPRILCDRAEAHIANDDFNEALRDYHEAMDIDDTFQRAREGIRRAQKLQKQSEKRDYYKILGVNRNADKREIIKAYRKAAQKWHPDNFKGDEKAKAEKKFIDIAAAKEVLTNAEKREKFDNGEDPLDPEAQQQQGFNPFQHSHFHGSPFTFKFQFN